MSGKVSTMFDVAVLLHGGRRRGAWKALAERLGVAPYTIRRWYSRDGDMPDWAKRLIVSLIKVQKLETRVAHLIHLSEDVR